MRFRMLNKILSMVKSFCKIFRICTLREKKLNSKCSQNVGLKMHFNKKNSSLNNWVKTIKMVAPFLWPEKHVSLQLRVIFCLLLLVAGRIINLYMPLLNKSIVDGISMSLNEKTKAKSDFAWKTIIIYVGLQFLQGFGASEIGCINNLRAFLWIGIRQFTSKKLEVELFGHLHSLSLRWHLGRKTGEVLRVMDRGTDSLNNLLNYILFSILPTIVDIMIAVIFFVLAFNLWFGLIVFTTLMFYIVLTIWITEWRTKYQRRMNLADNETRARSVDSLLNFETVKYYGAEQYEIDAFTEALLKYQHEEWKVNVTLNFLKTMQNVVICGGLLAGSLLCVHLVVNKNELTLGDYILFSSYIAQLYAPLCSFGAYYRTLQKYMVDVENMLDLLYEEKEVMDEPDAAPISLKEGATIDFKNVYFAFPSSKQLILNNISFCVASGKTIALVGPSGSGKTTILRLLFRFYDITSGSILIDGKNIKTVTQQSLRKAIGVVPQDTVLFNNTMKYNIKYGRISGSDIDVIEAAKAADIHNTIMKFPHRYDTAVGERGLRLSGGEKQRVAIARTLLKAPTVVLLDEATSALDTKTERNIQESLNKMCANRTTIIVAHRLSTIIHADEILVLQEGKIVERGRHEELLAQDKMYASMWKQQLNFK